MNGFAIMVGDCNRASFQKYTNKGDNIAFRDLNLKTKTKQTTAKKKNPKH